MSERTERGRGEGKVGERVRKEEGIEGGTVEGFYSGGR